VEDEELDRSLWRTRCGRVCGTEVWIHDFQMWQWAA